MPKYIVKLNDSQRDYYFEFSTVVDAPVTSGMTLDEFTKYYREQYGNASMDGFKERMARVERKGTSSLMHSSVEEVLACNRAGKNESTLTVEEILDLYCRPRKVT